MAHWNQVKRIQRVVLFAAAFPLLAMALSCTPEENPMLRTASDVMTRPAIPPIDASAPTQIETATFALG